MLTARTLLRSRIAFPLARISSKSTPVAVLARAMSTKSLEVLDASELKEGDHKAVDFEGGRVLLSKVGGEVYATQANCSHYGAPLEKGVLSADGRVVCPWHGACFNVKTGDIEDAPGLNSLEKYGVEVKDGKIVVTASLDKVKEKKGSRVVCKVRKPISATSKQTVVIVGGGSGAIHTLEALRVNDYDGNIIVLSQENYAPIDRTKLSKALVDNAKEVQWRTPQELKDDFGVDLRTGVTVTQVDTDKKEVTTSSGDKVKYDHLVLSPGAIPKKIPIEGKDLEGVVTIRHVEDVKKVTSHVGKDADIVVIGTSFIGLEAVLALTGKEHRSLTVVGVDKIPFEAMLGAEVGKAIVKSLEDKGAKFILGAKIEKITGENGRANKLHIEGQEPLPATTILMGTGVAPATEFLKNSAFELEKDGGLIVDEYLRVKGKENVYAIGDIAHYPQFPDKQSRRVEHWNVAGNHGRHVAHTISNPDAPHPYHLVPIFWSSVGGGLRYVGTGAKWEEQYVDGSESGLKFVLYQAKKDGQITTVASIGRDPYVSKAAELLRLGKMPKLDEIKAGKDILTIDTEQL